MFEKRPGKVLEKDLEKVLKKSTKSFRKGSEAGHFEFWGSSKRNNCNKFFQYFLDY